MAELSGKAEENQKAVRNVTTEVDQLMITLSDLWGDLANESKLLMQELLECAMANPEDQSEEASLPTQLPGTCPKGYKKYRAVCYKLFNERKSFSEAAKTCQAGGGTLAMPRDYRINAFLLSLMKEEDISHGIWFGLHDRVQEGYWKWIDGTPLNTWTAGYRDWAPGQPNSERGDDDCAAYSSDLWYDLDCRYKESFICEIVLTDTSGVKQFQIQPL
ncbi:perlucin-like protein [Branchiostoma floridae x Branchiostoma belcheri]